MSRNGDADLWILDELDRIKSLAQHSPTIGEAETAFLDLINSTSPKTLAKYETTLRDTAGASFLPKRRKNILASLSAATSGRPRARPSDQTYFASKDASALEYRLRSKLTDLSNHHIYSWSTHYRDFIRESFSEIFQLVQDVANPETPIACLHDALRDHAHEIFMKGFKYNADRIDADAVVRKSQAGLQRFLELPLEPYQNAAEGLRVGRSATLLRKLTSTYLHAILTGTGSAKHSGISGSQVLQSQPRAWAHYLPFLTKDHLVSFAELLGDWTVAEGMVECVVPIAYALDRLASADQEERFALPGLGQYAAEATRLEISLIPPTWIDDSGLLELVAFLDSGAVERTHLEQVQRRGFSVAVAALRPDLAEWVQSQPRFAGLVVNAGDGAGASADPSDRVYQVLLMELGDRKIPETRNTPLLYNFARDFPLHNQFLSRYFHVERRSVRALLYDIERVNGVRLWCSVRRSGKTTACFDLGSTTGLSTVVSQTCDSTDTHQDSSLLYSAIADLIEAGVRPQADFLATTVENLGSRVTPATRFVLAIDEYETLFGHLSAAADSDPLVRYRVVQPLLNQFVAFSKDNLVLFVGQRPDAHYILMEQNQLSAYVEQDVFPLFDFVVGRLDGEFVELLTKVLSPRIAFDVGFAHRVFQETAGHPFLTVNLLIVFFDWLIENGFKLLDLEFSEDIFADFLRHHYMSDELHTRPEYAFFRNAISEALGERGRSATPWLHAIYIVLRKIGLDSQQSLSIGRSDYSALFEKRLTPATGHSGDELLSGASQSNFLRFDKVSVWPKIPLLARIAAVSEPR
jgi:hypothetical protein